MVRAYYEDSRVSEVGSVFQLGDFMSSFARGASAIGNIVGAVIPFSVPLAQAFSSSALVVPQTVAGISLPASIAGAQIPWIAPIVGAVAATGGVLKGVSSIFDGKIRKGIKEILKGAAEGVFIGTAALFMLTGGSVVAGFALAAGEIMSKVMTGKTLAAHFGNIVGAALDAVVGSDEPEVPSLSFTRGNVRTASVAGPAMQQQVGMAATPAVQMGEMMPAANMAAISSFPAAVGGYSSPAVVQQQGEAGTYWRDYVTAQRGGMSQGQGVVRLPQAEAGRWAEAVDSGRLAALNGEIAH